MCNEKSIVSSDEGAKEKSVVVFSLLFDRKKSSFSLSNKSFFFFPVDFVTQLTIRNLIDAQEKKKNSIIDLSKLSLAREREEKKKKNKTRSPITAAFRDANNTHQTKIEQYSFSNTPNDLSISNGREMCLQSFRDGKHNSK